MILIKSLLIILFSLTSFCNQPKDTAQEFSKSTREEFKMHTQRRDYLLEKYLGSYRLQNMKDEERDLFVKRIYFDTKEQFFKKYKNQISLDNYYRFKLEIDEIQYGHY